MKRVWTLVMAVVCALASFAGAEELWAPDMEEYLKEAVMEDFVGSWRLVMVRSDKPVDMGSYRDVIIDAEGNAHFELGGRNVYASADVVAEPQPDGSLYIADPSGENGAYYVLFDETLMGCVETLDDPGTIEYLEKWDDEGETDDSNHWSKEAAEVIWAQIGDVQEDPGAEAFAGTWKAWSYSGNSSRRLILDPAEFEVELILDGDEARIMYVNRGDTTSYESAAVYEDGFMVIADEYGEENQYLILCGDNELALLDDPVLPTSVMYFYTADRWAEEKEAGNLDASAKLGEKKAITSLEEVAGEWTGTHINFGGAVMQMDFQLDLKIEADGRMIICQGDDEIEYPCYLKNGYLFAVEEGKYENAFALYGDVLVQAGEEDDFSMSLYYQRPRGE